MNATSDNLATLRGSAHYPHHEYIRKMWRRVPNFSVVDRVDYCLNKLRDKRVLSLGATGPMQEAVNRVAAKSFGTDIGPQEYDTFAGFWKIDLDGNPGELPDGLTLDIVFAGETLEHLSNPGNVLRELRKYGCPLLVTVPNAFAHSGFQHLKNGVEAVNADHVAYYSWWTLTNLLGRYGWKVKEFHWYNGEAKFSEGMIALAEA